MEAIAGIFFDLVKGFGISIGMAVLACFLYFPFSKKEKDWERNHFTLSDDRIFTIFAYVAGISFVCYLVLALFGVVDTYTYDLFKEN